MMRRNVRLRREYLYRKCLEGKEHLVYENKRKIYEALGKPIPTELRNEEAVLHQEIDLEDENTAVPHSTIDDEYANAADRDPKILLTTSCNPSDPLTQFVKELKIVFPNAQRMNSGGQNIEAQSSDASQLIPQHNYNLDVHALNTRHPGEFECREFRESILGVMPHHWDFREDTVLKLTHLRHHKRKTLKKIPGKMTNYPFHKPEEKQSLGKDVTKKVSNVIEKAVNIAKSAKKKQNNSK